MLQGKTIENQAIRAKIGMQAKARAQAIGNQQTTAKERTKKEKFLAKIDKVVVPYLAAKN